MNKKYKYEWKEIQDFYNTGKTWEDIKNQFGCCFASIAKAVKRGDFITNNKSDAIILAHKKHPESFKHTEETKQKLSKIRIEHLKEHPDQVPYKLNHHSKGPSYPEKYFKEVFELEKMDLGQYKRVSIYELDFYNDSSKLAVEVDGEQHYCDEKIVQSSARKDVYLKENGWIVFRIRWRDYQKLTLSERKKVIKEIKELLN